LRISLQVVHSGARTLYKARSNGFRTKPGC
jgi:hypothetical protein